jgi:hypothetical protein
LSGKGGYERVPTQDEPFEEALKQTKTTKKRNICNLTTRRTNRYRTRIRKNE